MHCPRMREGRGGGVFERKKKASPSTRSILARFPSGARHGKKEEKEGVIRAKILRSISDLPLADERKEEIAAFKRAHRSPVRCMASRRSPRKKKGKHSLLPTLPYMSAAVIDLRKERGEGERARQEALVGALGPPSPDEHEKSKNAGCYGTARHVLASGPGQKQKKGIRNVRATGVQV